MNDYGPLFRAAYATLHGGYAGEAAESAQRHGESLEQFLARSRNEALGRLRRRLEKAQPPRELRPAHGLLLRLMAAAVAADEALAAQVEAYRCGNMEETIAHSNRLNDIVGESARLDRELLDSLRRAEQAQPGTLQALGIEAIGPPAR